MKSKNTKPGSIRFHLSSIGQLIHALGFDKKLSFYILPIYYLLTVINAVIEATSMLLLVSLFTSASGDIGDTALPSYIVKIIDILGVSFKFPDFVYFLVIVFGINLITRLSLIAFEGVLDVKLRRRLQETVFRRLLLGEWSQVRGFRIGTAVGTNTQESMVVAKYLSSAMKSINCGLSTSVVLVIALTTSIQTTIYLGLSVLPFVFLMKKTFSIQSGLSKESAQLRNSFSADITDRFNGFLQVHVDHNYEYHYKQGIKSQESLMRLDVLIAYCQAITGSFNILLPFFALLSFAFWLFFTETSYSPDFSLIASVGILGVKAAGQLNGLVAMLGNLSRLSGSLHPVLNALNTVPVKDVQLIGEEVTSIFCNNVSYSYGSKKVIDEATFNTVKGVPLILKGRSGKGKTTLANLISGIDFPDSGTVFYQGVSGQKYPSNQYRAHVGFVTQDIYLFGGNLRSNLVADGKYSDEDLWSVLDLVEASDFVRSLGGLDMNIAEAGRSLSGGQRRRLGIARALVSGCDILILDEITSGLDKKNKDSVFRLIDKLSKSKVVVMISHEDLPLTQKREYEV